MSDWTDEEESAFINFIIAEAKISSNPIVPFNFCEKMKTLTKSVRTSTYLYFKLQRFKEDFSKYDIFDMATRENIISMLNISEKLTQKRIAGQSKVTEPDESEPTKDSSLNSENNLPDVSTNYDIDKRMLEFLVEKTRFSVYMTDTSFLKDFGEHSGHIEKYSQLSERYRQLKKQIHLATEYDKPTRVKMLILSKAAISDELLKDLRQTAAVAVDFKKRITEYAAFDGSFVLSRPLRPTRNSSYLDDEGKKTVGNNKSEKDIKEELEEEKEDEEEEKDDDDDDDYKEPYYVKRTTRSGRVSRQSSRYGSAQAVHGNNCSKSNDENEIVPKQEIDDEMECFNDSYELNTTTRSGRISRKRSTYDASVVRKKSEKRKSEMRCSTPLSSKRTRRSSRTAKLAPSVPKVANRRMRVVDSDPEEVDSADETIVIDSEISNDVFQLSSQQSSVSATESDEPISQESAAELTSVKDFLSSFRTMVLSLNAQSLVALEEKIEDAVEQLKDKGDHQIPIKKLRPILEATLEMLIP
ncbi:hypothetical protein CAEBREN_10856 [Caenorhabditis brenneri]|uniref:SPK domain-containing protein n=1 Tax=Caenorhabditis brenneri TaxID=135651 RepID=G0MRD2_CAEBE|nr:hypothetical protein CAEBREN_10856 [Caenorhabditis brenneri]